MTKRNTKNNVRLALLNKKLLTTKDLMKIYVPPLKKCEIPSNNPFFTRTIIPPRLNSLTTPAKHHSFLTDSRMMQVKFTESKVTAPASQTLMNWTVYSNTKPLLKQIERRMDYLKCMATINVP